MPTKVRAFARLVLAGCLPSMVHAQHQAPAAPARVGMSPLRAGFLDPPPSARLRCYWWWLNGNTDKPTITYDLEQMKAKGFGGALLVDANGSDQEGNLAVPAGPLFGSPAWMDLYTWALREADRLGLEITLNITSGWNLGGPDVTPAQASKVLTWTRTEVSGSGVKDLQLEAPEQRNGFYQQIAVLAYPLQHGTALQPRLQGPPLRQRDASVETGFSMPDATPMLSPGPEGTDPAAADAPAAAVRNLTSSVSADGHLRWDAPPGDWEILRIGYTDSALPDCRLPCGRVSTGSGAWQGLAIDYLSHDAFESYWNRTVEPLLTAAKPFHSLKYLATDSWEVGGTNWTGNFAAEFQRRRGYDPVPWLPVVAGRILGDRDGSTRFLTDLRRTVADLVVSEHYDVFATLAAKHGLGVQAESGGPHGAPIDALETFRRAAVPQSEFWAPNPHRSTDVERFFTKEASSAAHIYGQPLVAQEGETSMGPQWSEHLANDLKPSFDMAITEGMNRLVWHEFTSSPQSTGLPGQEYFAGTHINPKVTWWPAGDAFFQYLNRVQFLAQEGVPVEDVLYFYGNNVPSFVRLKAEDPAQVLPGFDYDVTDEDALLNKVQPAVGSASLIGPGGIRWRLLAMPQNRRLSPEALDWIEHYVAGGGVVVGLPPTSSTGRLGAGVSAHFAATLDALWGSCATTPHHVYGKGQVFCTADARDALQALHVLPDVELHEAVPAAEIASFQAPFDYVHRHLPAGEVYFVRNGSAQPETRQVTFRAHAPVVECWDPVTGEAEALQAEALADGRTTVTLQLPAFGSAAVVFAAAASPDAARPRTLQSETAVVPLQPWQLAFQADRGAPAAPLAVTDLRSWTESEIPGVRYFSGTATYTAEVEAPSFQRGDRVLLKLSAVHELARVRINGTAAGTIWAQPLTLRVDPWLRPGKNRLEIEVTNLWPNRIIGDHQPGVQETYTETNITKYTAKSPLLASGLVGPVEWVVLH